MGGTGESRKKDPGIFERVDDGWTSFSPTAFSVSERGKSGGRMDRIEVITWLFLIVRDGSLHD